MLKELAQSLASGSMSGPLSDGAELAPYVTLWREFASSAAGDEGRGWFLLERWVDNPMAEALEMSFPSCAEARLPVPDSYFAGRVDMAPCIVPIPEELLPHGLPGSLREAVAESWVSRQLSETMRRAEQRLLMIPLSAVLFSPANGRELVDHLARLGEQFEPGKQSISLFRYQDPRVMQRVWPVLSSEQRRLWLGPVRRWWSLTQPWRPWDLDVSQAPGHSWYRADADIVPIGVCRTDEQLHRLFSPLQWCFAHMAAIGNQLWMRFAMEGMTCEAQPDGETVTQLLVDGFALNLNSANIEDYAWASWRFGDGAAPVDWKSQPWSRRLNAALAKLSANPDKRLATALAQSEETEEA